MAPLGLSGNTNTLLLFRARVLVTDCSILPTRQEDQQYSLLFSLDLNRFPSACLVAVTTASIPITSLSRPFNPRRLIYDMSLHRTVFCACGPCMCTAQSTRQSSHQHHLTTSPTPAFTEPTPAGFRLDEVYLPVLVRCHKHICIPHPPPHFPDLGHPPSHVTMTLNDIYLSPAYLTAVLVDTAPTRLSPPPPIPNIDILVSRFTQLETSAYPTSIVHQMNVCLYSHAYRTDSKSSLRDTCVTLLAQAAPYSPSPVHIWTRSRHAFRISPSSLSLSRARAGVLPLTSPNGHHIKSFLSPYRPDKGCGRMGWRKTGPIEVGFMASWWDSCGGDGVGEEEKKARGPSMACWASSRFSSRLHPNLT